MDVSEFLTGQPWDPETDEEYQAVLRQLRTKPPTCLQGFVCTPKHSEKWDHQARWAIACKCGSAKGAVLGHVVQHPNYPSKKPFVGPLAFRCSACDTVTEMFDTMLHGYDAEISKGTSSFIHVHLRGEGPRSAAGCPKCRGTTFTVVCSFSHSHFDHIWDEPELLGAAQDYFDGFGPDSTCAACGHEACLTGFELA